MINKWADIDRMMSEAEKDREENEWKKQKEKIQTRNSNEASNFFWSNHLYTSRSQMIVSKESVCLVNQKAQSLAKKVEKCV